MPRLIPNSDDFFDLFVCRQVDSVIWIRRSVPSEKEDWSRSVERWSITGTLKLQINQNMIKFQPEWVLQFWTKRFPWFSRCQFGKLIQFFRQEASSNCRPIRCCCVQPKPWNSLNIKNNLKSYSGWSGRATQPVEVSLSAFLCLLS